MVIIVCSAGAVLILVILIITCCCIIKRRRLAAAKENTHAISSSETMTKSTRMSPLVISNGHSTLGKSVVTSSSNGKSPHQNEGGTAVDMNRAKQLLYEQESMIIAMSEHVNGINNNSCVKDELSRTDFTNLDNSHVSSVNAQASKVKLSDSNAETQAATANMNDSSTEIYDTRI